MEQPISKTYVQYVNNANSVMTIFVIALHSSFFPALNSPFSIWFGKFLSSLYVVAVPVFFVVSGFLFYSTVPEQNCMHIIREKLGRRFFSLVIPYFLFSLFWMLTFFVAGKLPFVGNMIKNTSLYNQNDFCIKSFLLASFVPPLWYLRTLLVLHFIGVPIFVVNKFLKKSCFKRNNYFIPFVMLLVFIHNTFVSLPSYTSVFYWIPAYLFGMLIAICIKKIGLFTENFVCHKKIGGIFICIYVLLAFIASFVNESSPFYYVYRYVSSFVMLLILLFYRTEKTAFLSKHTFFMYMLHFPICHMLSALCVAMLPHGAFCIYIVMYVAVVGFTTALIVGISMLLSHVCPVAWNILNGMRKK